MTTIKIIIAGKTGSGKSTIAAAISSYLQSININHEAIIEDKPTSAGDMVAKLKTLRENGLKVNVQRLIDYINEDPARTRY